MLGGGDRKVKGVTVQCEWRHEGSERRAPQKHLVGARPWKGVETRSRSEMEDIRERS